MSVISLAEHKRCRCGQHHLDAETIIHLPVAPQVVARTRFSPLTPIRSQCLMVPEALEMLSQVLSERRDEVTMVAITGPGDPLATPDITLSVVQLVKKRFPNLRIGLKTLGIGSDKLAADLARAGVDHVEILVNGVKEEILEKLYAWIRPGLKTLKITEAVKLLITEQRNGVPALKFHNLKVVIQTTLYPSHNLNHIVKISNEMMELGADSIALVPYVAETGAEVDLESPDEEAINIATAEAMKYLPVVRSIFENRPETDILPPSVCPSRLTRATKERPNIAVVSSNGIEVDLHLGHAITFLIYGPREDGLNCLLETREAPEPGSGEKRWLRVAETLSDCFILLAASAGETPRRLLAEHGLKVVISSDNIEGTVDALYGGGKKGKKKS